jgi:hypothetical protein
LIPHHGAPGIAPAARRPALSQPPEPQPPPAPIPPRETITGLAKAFGVSADDFVKMIEAEQFAESKGPRRAGRPRKAPRADAKPAKGKGKKGA